MIFVHVWVKTEKMHEPFGQCSLLSLKKLGQTALNDFSQFLYFHVVLVVSVVVVVVVVVVFFLFVCLFVSHLRYDWQLS